MKLLFCCLPRIHMFLSPITGQSVIFEWQRLNRKYQGVLDTNDMPMLIVGFRVICTNHGKQRGESAGCHSAGFGQRSSRRRFRLGRVVTKILFLRHYPLKTTVSCARRWKFFVGDSILAAKRCSPVEPILKISGFRPYFTIS